MMTLPHIVPTPPLNMLLLQVSLLSPLLLYALMYVSTSYGAAGCAVGRNLWAHLLAFIVLFIN